MITEPKKKSLEELVESLANFTYEGFQRMEDRFKLLVEQGELNRADIQDLKRMVTQLVLAEAGRDKFEITTNHRLGRIEKHLAIAS